jgi:hypothetical protein
MTTEAADATPEDAAADVLVPETVIGKMRDELLPSTAKAVAQAIMRIPKAQGTVITLNVPGDPEGIQYRALLPPGSETPAVIYRDALPGETGKWRVTALMDRDAYVAYSKGLADDAVVQGVAAAVAVAGTAPSVQGSPTRGSR